MDTRAAGSTTPLMKEPSPSQEEEAEELINNQFQHLSLYRPDMTFAVALGVKKQLPAYLYPFISQKRWIKSTYGLYCERGSTLFTPGVSLHQLPLERPVGRSVGRRVARADKAHSGRSTGNVSLPLAVPAPPTSRPHKTPISRVLLGALSRPMGGACCWSCSTRDRRSLFWLFFLHLAAALSGLVK